jgi:hypothetical protein
MAIEVLGKSLLSAARKKNKKKKRFGNIAALALVGITGANAVIRKKALKRAKEFENSLLPMETALKGERKRITEAETRYNNVMKEKGETGTEREVFTRAEKKRLKGLVNSGPNTAKYNDEELNKLAFSGSQDEYNAWVNDTETYKPYFGIKDEEYYKNFKTLKTEGTKYIEEDNLSRRFNKKFGLSDEDKMIEAKIAFDNAEKEELVLSLPERLHKQLDIPFLQKLNKIKINKMSYGSVETSTKLYNEDGEIDILMEQIIEPKAADPTKEKKLDSRIQKAYNNVMDDSKDSETYMGDITFAASDPEGKITTSTMTIQALREQLKTTKGGQPIDKTQLNTTSDWDSITAGALEQAQLLLVNHVQDKPDVLVTEPMLREFVADGLRQSIRANVVISPKVKGEGLIVLTGAKPETVKLRLVDTPPPPREDSLAKTFIKSVEANGVDIESDNIQKQLLRLIKENPETKDELTPYIINKEIGTSEVEEEPVVETTTSKSLLDPEETVETETSSSLLSPNDIEGRMQQGMKKMGEESFKLRSIPSKMKLRAFNQTKKRADKFLEGKTSGFYSTEFTKWKRENSIVTNFKTPKDEYRKYVEEFLEDLENQFNSV